MNVVARNSRRCNFGTVLGDEATVLKTRQRAEGRGSKKNSPSFAFVVSSRLMVPNLEVVVHLQASASVAVCPASLVIVVFVHPLGRFLILGAATASRF